MAESFTGNPLRDATIVAAVRQICAEGHQPTLAAVAAICNPARFGATFDEVSEDEIFGALAALEAEADAHAQSLNEQHNEQLTAVVGAAAVSGDADPSAGSASPPLSRDGAIEALRVANQNLATFRALTMTLSNKRVAARTKLSEAIQAYQAGQPRISRELLVRQEIAAGNLAREMRKHQPARVMPCGPSVIDRTAMAWKGGNGAPGGGNAFRRGASTRRGIQVRPPSER